MLQSISNDSLSKDILRLYKGLIIEHQPPEQWNEEIHYAKVNFLTK